MTRRETKALALPTYVQERVNNAIVPVQLTKALAELRECRNIDFAKYYADKADALAAAAKVYRDDEAGEEARLLKIAAYETMGKLAFELRPGTGNKGKGTGSGGKAGPLSLLREHGLSAGQASSATALARASDEAKKDFIENTRRSATTAFNFRPFMGNSKSPVRTGPGYQWLMDEGLGRLRAAMRKRSPGDAAAGVFRSEAPRLRELVLSVIEWLDEFERRLPR